MTPKISDETLKEWEENNRVFLCGDDPDLSIVDRLIARSYTLIDTIRTLRKQNEVLRESLEASAHGEGWKNCPSCSREESAKKALAEADRIGGKECPPHKWDNSGERCEVCGTKGWMT